MRLILVRHCQTDWNVEGRMQGHIDTTLNATGKIQAEAVALKIQRRNLNISAIISSDLIRALQTAAIIGRRIGVPVRSDERLRECDLGRLNGHTWKEMVEGYGVVRGVIYNNDKQNYDFRSFGGECRDDVIDRQRNLLDELLQKYADKSIVLVGHGTSLNSLLSFLGYAKQFQVGEVLIRSYPAIP